MQGLTRAREPAAVGRGSEDGRRIKGHVALARQKLVRQQGLANREFLRRVAGEDRHGDAGQGLKWNPTAIAHLAVAGTSPEKVYSGGATARGGGAATGKRQCGYGHARDYLVPAKATLQSRGLTAMTRRPEDDRKKAGDGGRRLRGRNSAVALWCSRAQSSGRWSTSGVPRARR